MVLPVSIWSGPASGDGLAVEPMRHAAERDIAEGVRAKAFGKILVADRPKEAIDRQRSDRCAPPVRCRREGAAMHHRVADLDARGPAIGDQAAGLALKRGEKPRHQRFVSLAEMHRRRQLTLKLANDP